MYKSIFRKFYKVFYLMNFQTTINCRKIISLEQTAIIMHKQLPFSPLIIEDEQFSPLKIHSLALELFHFAQFFLSFLFFLWEFRISLIPLNIATVMFLMNCRLISVLPTRMAFLC